MPVEIASNLYCPMDPIVRNVSVHYYIKIRSEHKIRQNSYRLILKTNSYEHMETPKPPYNAV